MSAFRQTHSGKKKLLPCLLEPIKRRVSCPVRTRGRGLGAGGRSLPGKRKPQASCRRGSSERGEDALSEDWQRFRMRGTRAPLVGGKGTTEGLVRGRSKEDRLKEKYKGGKNSYVQRRTRAQSATGVKLESTRPSYCGES